MTKEIFPDVSVMFRKWKTCEDVIALFPYMSNENCKATETVVESYDSYYGHGNSDFDFIMQNTVPACKPIYRELKETLEAVGYLLRIIEEVDQKQMESIYS